MSLMKKLEETTGYLKGIFNDLEPQVALILGSGLGEAAEMIEQAVVVNYADIPHFPVSTVTGHAGQLVTGKLGEKTVLAMKGRFHFYEGYPMEEVTYPIRVMQQIGIKTLIITNAAGGINRDFLPGDLMLINDHLNLTGQNPLRGANYGELGPRFPDLSEAYDQKLIKKAHQAAKKLNMVLKEGVYAALTGPSYETRAEINFMRTIGADAVGMSTVPEVIVANHGEQKVLGISCITNLAAGVSDQKLSHQEVMETASKVKNDFIRLVQEIVKLI